MFHLEYFLSNVSVFIYFWSPKEKLDSGILGMAGYWFIVDVPCSKDLDLQGIFPGLMLGLKV